MDARVFALGIIGGLLTFLLFGLLPALRGCSVDLRSLLQSGGFSSSPRRSWIRGSLVVIQVAMSMALLAGAGLFVRTLQKAKSIDTGFNPRKVLVASVDLLSARYDETRGVDLYARLLRSVSQLPGVRAATWAGDVPLAVRRLRIRFIKGDQPVVAEHEWTGIDCNVVGPRYFETLAIPLLKGRDFSESDHAASSGVVVVNEAMARAYWPGEDPVGKKLKVHGRTRELYQVIGVARDVRQRSLWDSQGPYLYLPLYQRYFPEMMLHVRTAGDPMSLLPLVRHEIETLDRDLPVFDAGPLMDQLDRAVSAQRVSAALLGASGTLALVLAAVGVYGVMSYTAAQRTREFGIRMALGSGPARIGSLVLRDAAALVGIGLAAGLVLALGTTRLTASFLHGVSPTDPLTFAVSSAMLALAALAACALPAVRAARIDPLTAIRQE